LIIFYHRTYLKVSLKYYRRIEQLVFAAYVLNGTLTHRSVAIAALIMKTYPEESPISEKVLRIYKRINEDCLPSEHFQRRYSVAKIAQKVWESLMADDFELYQHLQAYTEDAQYSPSFVPEAALHSPRSILKKGRISRQSMANVLDVLGSSSISSGGSSSATLSPDKVAIEGNDDDKSIVLHPKCFVLLRGWVEMGFYSWIPEPAVFFLWDQIAIAGAEKDGGIIECFEKFISSLCCILLELLRGDLLLIHENMVDFLRQAGRKLKTRAIVNAFRSRFYPEKAFVDRSNTITSNTKQTKNDIDGEVSVIASPSHNNKSLNVANTPDSSIRLKDSIAEFAPQPIVVSYITDLEGNIDSWNRFIEMSEVLSREQRDGAGLRQLVLKDNCHLVYGGDVCDRGPGSVRFTQELIKLKMDYPENVHLIMGNRDINKLRIPIEVT